MKTVKALVFRVGEEPKVEMIGDDLASLQALVGRYIECVYPFDKPYVLVCNEEGKLIGLDPNKVIHGDVICGNFAVFHDDEEGGFDDIHESDIPEIEATLKPYNGESTEPYFEFFSFA